MKKIINSARAQELTAPGAPSTKRCGGQSDGSYIMCDPIPGISPVQANPAAFLRELYILAFIIAGTVAFARIVYGGIIYSTSGVVDQKNKAKGIFIGVAQGIALLMGSYLILNAINPALVNLRFPDVDNYFPPIFDNMQINREGMPSPLSSLPRVRTADDNPYFFSGEIWGEQQTLDLIQDEIDKVGDPKTPQDAKRLRELNGYMTETNKLIEERKANDARRAAELINPSTPRRYQRTPKTSP